MVIGVANADEVDALCRVCEIDSRKMPTARIVSICVL